ncbi:glycoside hydrolase family 97 protein [Parabacteroides sp. Marseille-P3160]|uniref:glycoside hydrolase family 97 protein n=1 Tax=Parabacteroides sp. Marseille-P3160 TaxID=1917887 RepID=UPI0009BB274C|nr:glycoside hydrolase family 97 protein [Parabacteroides sp. Marseille-P3160]
MKRIILLLLVVLSLINNNLYAKTIELTSPNKEIKVSILLADKIYYSVSYNNDELLKECYMRLILKDNVFGEQPKLTSRKQTQVNETLTPVIPLKYTVVNNYYNQLRLTFKGNYVVEFRAFNDGIAYRFITNNKDEAYVTGEDFVINFPDAYLAHLQQPQGFKTAYEEAYTHIKTNEWKPSDKMSALPVLIDTQKPYKILISESDLSDYPCMFLKGTEENGMRSTFPKVPLEFGEDGDRSVKILKEADYIAQTSGKRSYPWRYFVITKNDKQLVENTMTYRLAAKNQITDPSWIKPGQASWEWWNGATPYGADVNFVAGCNLDTYKYFIDFASQFGIPYIIMDEGWAQSTRDPYTPNPTVDVHEIIRYGKEKNVGVVLWLTWLTVENNFDIFKTFKEWGIKGVKIDFMDRSDQWMVNYYERVAREAAKHKLFVDFHGSFKPAGLEYKYPNVLSYEGVRGMEQMGGCYPDNSLYLPFMRNAVGPMDYTPGAMISMQPDVYRSERPNSASIGTRAYQMALFVIFESGIQMLADNPTLYYNNRECTEFITEVPVTWDETRALKALVGDYVIVAKRKGNKWFIGGITNNKEKERTFEIPLDFLPDGKSFRMTSFEDGINAGYQAMDYRKKETTVKSDDKISVKMVRNGGWVAVIE